MLIGGFQKFSLIDYPSKICAIVFTQSCNFRCPYCHNPELVDSELFSKPIQEKEIFSFLEKRKRKLDAVEVTGGEPTLQQDLIDFLKKIKSIGYLIKLDTNGSRPDVIEKVLKLKLVDYLAMDIKAPLEKYKEIVHSALDMERITKSIELIMKSGLDYEFRTTVVKSQLTKEDIIEIAKLIKGAKLYIIQKFVPSKVLSPNFLKDDIPYSDEEFLFIRKEMKRYVKRFVIR